MAQTLEDQPNNTEVRVKPQNIVAIIFPIGFHIVFKAGDLGNIFRLHNEKSVYSSLKHKVTPNKYPCS